MDWFKVPKKPNSIGRTSPDLSLPYTCFHVSFLIPQFWGYLIHGVTKVTNHVFYPVNWLMYKNPIPIYRTYPQSLPYAWFRASFLAPQFSGSLIRGVIMATSRVLLAGGLVLGIENSTSILRTHPDPPPQYSEHTRTHPLNTQNIPGPTLYLVPC